MSGRFQSQWAKVAGFIVGYQAAWIADIGLKSGLFHSALKPGGTLLAAELPNPDSPSPAYRMLAGVELHEALVGCGAITRAELPELLHAAGFSGVRVADQPMPTRFVMLADKPA